MSTERPTRNEADITVVLGAAGTNTANQRIPRTGRTFECISVTTEGVVKIGLGQSADSGRTLRTGMGNELMPGDDAWDFIELANTSAGAVTVVLQTDMGSIVDNRLILQAGVIPTSVSGVVKTDDQGADGVNDVVDQVVAAGGNYVVAANANRRALIVYNTSATDTAKWGAAPDATHGIPIPPQSMQSIPLSAAFKIYNAGAANITLNVVELTHT